MAAVADVSLNGLEGEVKNNVERTLSLQKEDCAALKWKISRLFAKSDDEIVQALQALGYYRSHIVKHLIFNEDCWQARFDIELGPRVSIDRIDISFLGEARDDVAFQKLKEKLQAQVGMPLHQGHYEKMKKQIDALAMERGYLKGVFLEKQLLIDKANDKARISWVFDSGKRLMFGAISLDQNSLDDQFVKKYISIKEGDFYDGGKLAKFHDALSKSGYFDSIDIHQDMEAIDHGEVPIGLKLYPKKPHHYSFGIGYDTDKGPLLGASYLNHRLNRQGHFLNSELELSPVLSTADIEYSVPLDNPVSDFLSFGAGLKREDTQTYNSLAAKLSARLKHAFASGWKQTLFIDSSYESFHTGIQSDNTLLLLPGASWLRSVSNTPLRPTEGYHLEFNLAGSYRNPLSDISLVQASLAAVWMHGMPGGGRLMLRGEQGASVVDRFDKLPTTYRYYAGGMDSIRGYAYKALGPKDAQGNVKGGTFLSVLSLEYEQSILEDWGVAAFLDGGNAYDLDAIQFKSGAGLGVRWYSPMGLVRVDFAVPLNESNDSYQIHFAAGTRL